MPGIDPTFVKTLTQAQVGIEVAATAAFALSGVVAAARKQLDVVGVAAVACVAAFGGGTLRDVLLDRRPFFWVAHGWYLWLVLGIALAAMLWLRARHVQPTLDAMQWPDALGLGLFAASGTQIALAAAMPPLVAVLMGVITAVCGGVLRDMVCNEIPSAFHDHRPYAVCAFAAGWVVVGLRALGWGAHAELALGALLGVALRMAAVRWNVRLPGWGAHAPPPPPPPPR